METKEYVLSGEYLAAMRAADMAMKEHERAEEALLDVTKKRAGARQPAGSR